MFGLKDRIIARWAAARPDRAARPKIGGSEATTSPSGELRP
jgi:hypothetical protein